MHAALQIMQLEAAAIGAKCVGEDNVGAGVDKLPVQQHGPLGMRGVPQFRAVAGGQPHGEKIGARRAISEQRAILGKQALQH